MTKTLENAFHDFDTATVARLGSLFDGFLHAPRAAERFDRTFQDISEALRHTLGAAEVIVWVPDGLVPTLDPAPAGTLRPALASLAVDAPPTWLDASRARAAAAIAAGTAQFHAAAGDAPATWTVAVRGAAGRIREPRTTLAVAQLCYPDNTPPAELAPEVVDLCGRLAGRAVERALWAEQELLTSTCYGALDTARCDRFAAADPVAVAIADAMQFEACSILLRDAVSRTMLIVGTTGIDSRKPRRRMRYPYGFSCSGRVAAEKAILAVECVDEAGEKSEPLFTDAVESPESRQFLGVPVLTTGSALLGVIRLRNKRGGAAAGWLRELNGLDVLRGQRTAEVLATLLLLMAHDLQGASVLERVRHDMDMPATMIRDSAGHLRRLDDERLSGRLEDVRQKLEDFESLAEILLLNSELLRVQDARDLPFEPEHIMPMGEFVAKLCKMLTPAARRKGLAGVLYVDDTFRSVPKLWLDGRFMQIALYNLLQNGIKYSDDGTFIVVEAEPTRIDDAPWYQIHVRNSGIGIDEADADRIFHRTYRTTRAMRKNSTGLGIGLSVARAMVERHGGRLVLTRFHDPTVFTIQLPGSLAEQKPR